MKRVLAAIISLVLLAGGAEAATYSGGSGTVPEPYQINSVADWNTLAATSADWGKCFIQTADIDFSSAGNVRGVGASTDSAFMGTYDGDGHTISNIHLAYNVGRANFVGMFLWTKNGAVIRNVTVTNATVTGTSPVGNRESYCAVLVAYNADGCTISDCTVNGTVTYAHTQPDYDGNQLAVAGVIAGMNKGIITDCTASGSITFSATGGTSLRIGGICGQQWSSGSLQYTRNCISTVSVSCDSAIGAETTYVGGVCGYLEDCAVGNIRNYLENCHYKGTINVNNTGTDKCMDVGGVVGRCHSDMRNCSAKGTITALCATTATTATYPYGAFNVGGIAGELNDSIDGCFADCAISVGYATVCNVGGGVGTLYYSGSATDSYARGSLYDLVQDSSELHVPGRAGGFVGEAGAGVMANCWCATREPFTGGSGHNVGGFMGTGSQGTKTGCYWDTDTSGIASGSVTGLTGKTTAEMQTPATYAGYVFAPATDYKWKMIAGIYPMLGWQTYQSGGGDGSTEALAILIGSVDDWNMLAASPADWGKCFRLTADLDFAGAGSIRMIGNSIDLWKGIFDGGGHRVSNITLTTIPDADNHMSLFAKTETGAIIRNLVVKNATIVGSSPNAGKPSYCAIIVSENKTGALVQNCSVSGTIAYSHTTTSYGICGMVVGADYGSVENCTASGTITIDPQSGSDIRVGGVVGLQTGTANVAAGHLSNCTADVNISNSGDIQAAVSYIGGVCGLMQQPGGIAQVYVDGCHWRGSINCTSTSTSKSMFVGGVIGSASGMSAVSNSSAAGSIAVVSALTGAGPVCVGGAIGGTMDAGSTIDTCSSDCDISVGYVSDGVVCVGGFMGISTVSTIRNCYARGSLYDATTGSNSINFKMGGGFIGRIASGTCTNCWCALEAFSVYAGNPYVAGFVGYVSGTPTLNGLLWDTTSCGLATANAGATGKTTAEMQTQATYAGYVLAPTAGYKWKMAAGMYPMLGWETYQSGGGDGSTEASAILIGSVADWKTLAATPADWGKCFRLSADIDFAAAGPIGMIGANTGWAGKFDGDGYAISNMTLSATPDAANHMAIFAFASPGSVIKNLTVRNATVVGSSPNTGHSAYTAVLVSESAYGAMVQDCVVTNATVTATYTTSSYSQCGMVVGADHGIVKNCTVSGTITVSTSTGSDLRVGGVVGLQRGGVTGAEIGYASGCHADVAITLTNTLSSASHVGGIAGTLDVATGGGSNYIDDCHWTGSISAATTSTTNRLHVGGAAGYMGGMSLARDSSAKGKITVASALANTGECLVGGFTGQAQSSPTIDSCFADCSISVSVLSTAAGYVGGFIGYANIATVQNCYAKGSLYDAKEGSTTLSFYRGGGFVGILRGTFADCWCAMTPFVAGHSEVGGFYGVILSSPTLSGLYWDTETCGFTTEQAGATGKGTLQMKTESTFTAAGWDFTNETANGTSDYWRMCEDGVSYPRLNWQSNTADFACPDGVDFVDYAILANQWLAAGCEQTNNWCNRADIDESGMVDRTDLLTMAENWLAGARRPGDLNADGKVDFTDYAILSAQWGKNDCTGSNDFCGGADVNGSGAVDMQDLAILAENWLGGR